MKYPLGRYNKNTDQISVNAQADLHRMLFAELKAGFHCQIKYKSEFL